MKTQKIVTLLCGVALAFATSQVYGGEYGTSGRATPADGMKAASQNMAPKKDSAGLRLDRGMCLIDGVSKAMHNPQEMAKYPKLNVDRLNKDLAAAQQAVTALEGAAAQFPSEFATMTPRDIVRSHSDLKSKFESLKSSFNDLERHGGKLVSSMKDACKKSHPGS